MLIQLEKIKNMLENFEKYLFNKEMMTGKESKYERREIRRIKKEVNKLIARIRESGKNGNI